jgi:glycosyltransferase involved in cell wall biosynthesis
MDLFEIAEIAARSSTGTGGAKRDWIVCQSGAREHYALAAELHSRGRLRALCTDVWAGERSVWRAAATFDFIGGRKIRERFEPSLADAKVIALDPFTIMGHRLVDRISSRHNAWRRLIAADRLFSSSIAHKLARFGLLRGYGPRPVVFAYSYAAREILAVAKRAGCTTVLGQIDPGPDEELIAEVARRHGFGDRSSERAPDCYWRNWRDECALADLILVNSDWAASSLGVAGIDTSKVKVAPLAFRSNARNRVGFVARAYPTRFTSARPLRLLFLGKANVRKGALELVDAMRRLENAPVRLRVVGRSDMDARKSAQGCRNIEWSGEVPRGATSAFFRDSDLFILPTHSDGFGITQLEALAHDLPVIASRNCGDVIEHGVQGLRLEQVTAENIESAVRFVLSHPERLAEMSERASARLAQFSPERVVDALLDAVEGES